MMDSLFIFLQHIAPQHLLSRGAGWLAECRTPVIKNTLIDLFVRQFDVDLDEALEKNAHHYPTFNAFFTRALEAGARPVCDTAFSIACPADGAISQLGYIEQGNIFQAKGKQFTASALLGGDEALASHFRDGTFATIYLSPRDYHRVHMPLPGELQLTRYIPGELFSVNNTTAMHVNRLFARNERLLCLFDTPAGKMAVILVGAMIVAGIETVWAGQVAPPPRTITTTRYDQTPSVKLGKGDELGRFKLGSTVILLFEKDACDWSEELIEGRPTRMGEEIGIFTPVK